MLRSIPMTEPKETHSWPWDLQSCRAKGGHRKSSSEVFFLPALVKLAFVKKVTRTWPYDRILINFIQRLGWLGDHKVSDHTDWVSYEPKIKDKFQRPQIGRRKSTDWIARTSATCWLCFISSVRIPTTPKWSRKLFPENQSHRFHQPNKIIRWLQTDAQMTLE